MISTKVIHHLEKDGFYVWDEFLSPSELALLHEDFQLFRSAGSFKRAGIGKGTDFHLNDGIRKDETCWWDPLALNRAQKMLWEKLETLKDQINQHFFPGLWSFEGHYSYYPIGGFYQAHLDRFSNDDARTLSMVLYLNEDWKDSDGGELRIYPKDQNLSPIQITPLGGRLICFWSAEILHEVLPAKHPRFSFAGWWKRREP